MASQDRRSAEHPRQKPLLLIAGGVFLSVLLIACVAWTIATNRDAALKDASRELENLSRALSESTNRAFKYAEVVQNDVIGKIATLGLASGDDFEKLRTEQIHASLKDKIADSSCLDAVSIIDSSGKLVNSSRSGPIPDVDVSDRDYFKALSNASNANVFIGEPVQNRENGTWTIYLAKRLVSPDNQFIGLVLTAMNVSYFERSYSSFAMPGGRVSLFRNNGTPLALYPHVDTEYTASSASLPIFDGTATQDAGTVFVDSLGNGISTRLLQSFNRLSDYPLVMSVSKSQSAVLADWQKLMRIAFFVTVCVVLFIASTVVVMLRSIKRSAAATALARSAAENELAAQQAIARHAGRFEVAINNMLHGLAMFDTQERMIVCNQRYSDMYSLPPELAAPGARRDLIIAHVRKTFGFPDAGLHRIYAHLPTVPQGEDLHGLELGDGRTVLVRSNAVDAIGWVVTHEDITQRRKADDRLSYLARHDALTGLPNRVLLQERMEVAIQDLAKGRKFAVMCLDLDHFKEINDTLGHAVGDEVLRNVAARLACTVNASDTIARMGGDEFAIIQSPLASAGDAIDLAERIVDAVIAPYTVFGNIITIGASVGIACAPRDGDVGARLLSKADIALYRAKLDGRRRHRFFEPAMEEELNARRLLDLDLRRALEHQEFEVYFQPLVDARTKSIRSFEALVRWNHPDRGLIPPLDFIPLAEETGLIGPLGEWILAAACTQAASWPEAISVSVNISVAQFKLCNLADVVSRTLAIAQLAPGRLELEITESVLLNENDNNLAVLHALRALGVKIVMDDFGTGYSSLNYLRVFPFDKIKIDKSFIQNLDHNSANEIVRLIADLGRKLGMQTTAEGVETEAQLEQVIQLGCTQLQGYLFSRPIPAHAIAALLGLSKGRQAA